MKRLPFVSMLTDLIYPYYAPVLKKKLQSIRSNEDVEEYIDKSIMSGLIVSISLSLFFVIILWVFVIVSDPLSIILAFIILLILTTIPMVYLNLKRVDVIQLKMKKAIDYDLVFAVKHMIIALYSGTPIFDAIVGVTKGYGQVSLEFKRIIERVALGDSLTVVLREEADATPSNAFKRVLIQLANAVVSGADVANSLEVVIDQIGKEQLLEVKEYGQTLNPLVMFYLIIGVILPSLGVAFFIILLSFVSKGIKLPFIQLVGLAIVIGLVQFLFLAFIESTRPRYAMMA